MWLKWVQWRIDSRPDLIKAKDVKKIPLKKYFTIHKTDKHGRTLVVLKPGFLEEDVTPED